MRLVRVNNGLRRASMNSGSSQYVPFLLLKIHRGGFAADAYSLRQPGARLIGSSMLGRTTRERLVEWNLERGSHPLAKSVGMHVSYSVPSGIDLSDSVWNRVVRRHLSSIGADVSYVLIKHDNATHKHVHCVFSRCLPNGRLLDRWQNYVSWREALREVERELGFQARLRGNRSQIRPTDIAVNAVRRAHRRGTLNPWVDPKIILLARDQSASWAEFSIRLADLSVQMSVCTGQDGRPQGVLFRACGAEEWISGSSFSSDLSYFQVDRAFAVRQSSDILRTPAGI